MSELDNTRKKINEIDKEIAKLFEERMVCSKEVAEYKIKHAMPIFDASREQEVIDRNAKMIENDVIREYYINFLKQTMDISKQYQARLIKGMRVAYSGVEGAFAHIAAMKMFPGATYISYPNFTEAYNAVVDGLCDTCILPLENSFAGDVGVVMDLIFSGSLYINQVIELEVVHNLLAKKGSEVKDIKKVISHAQALNQCLDYINKKGFETIDAPNTALAAKMVAENDDMSIAAIASNETADLYDLEILESNINSSHNNTTRFGAFSRSLNTNATSSKMGEHFIIVFTVKNEAGALAKTLNIIGSHGFNMRNLRSRPMKELIWNYYFYVELEGDINSNDGKDMMRALSIFCDKLKLVGTYTYQIEK
ncbi:MAG: chorismate mutase [Bacilli bacterium]|nr:chorismate mutase [Bacilli bacterium]